MYFCSHSLYEIWISRRSLLEVDLGPCYGCHRNHHPILASCSVEWCTYQYFYVYPCFVQWVRHYHDGQAIDIEGVLLSRPRLEYVLFHFRLCSYVSVTSYTTFQLHAFTTNCTKNLFYLSLLKNLSKEILLKSCIILFSEPIVRQFHSVSTLSL